MTPTVTLTWLALPMRPAIAMAIAAAIMIISGTLKPIIAALITAAPITAIGTRWAIGNYFRPLTGLRFAPATLTDIVCTRAPAWSWR